MTNDPNLPVTTTPPPPATPPPAWRPPGMRQRLLPIVFVLLALLIYSWIHPRPNPNEALATRVTTAIMNNDMKPVTGDFNAADWRQLADHARVGRLSDELNALGKLQSLKEDTPSGSDPATHHFTLHFERGTWVETMTFDPTGKITAFRVRPATAPGVQP